MFNLKVYTMKRQRFFEGLGLKVYVTLAICMALLLNVQFLNAQSSTINVKGVVNDAMGPVIGASVVEKGNATNGTITDIDGNFSLKVPSDATLTISFIGYKTVELPVAGKTSFTVTLKEDSEMLDEVVVVGFGTQKKVNLTGSVGLATAKEIEARPVANATQALQGLVPGLQITTNTGELDKNMSINIRGNGTIGDGSSGSPLILIDGMEGDINTVNPQDIENISVLKDAAASSIYGSRAPFGVILVTTKKGKSGKPTINYNNSFRFNSPVNLPEMMDSYTFANYFNEAARNGQDNAQFSDTVMQQMLDFQAAGGTNRGGLPTDGNVWGKPAGDPFTTAYANTDWFSEIYKGSSFSQEHNFSVSGGGDKFNYYASLGYLDQNGLLRHGSDDLKRYNATAKFGAELTKWLKVGGSLSYAYQKERQTDSMGDGGITVGRQIVEALPFLPVRYEDGTFAGNNDYPGMEGGNSPVQVAKDRNYTLETQTMLGNVYANITILPGLEFRSVLGANIINQKSNYYGGRQLIWISSPNGSASVNNNRNNSWQFENYVTYHKDFARAHSFTGMVGLSWQHVDNSSSTASATGFEDDFFQYNNLGIGTSPSAASSANAYGLNSYFARVNYGYRSKYLLTATARLDGSSKFGQSNRYAFFPSVGAAWRISEESFMKPATAISNLKLRASYGLTGNSETGAYASQGSLGNYTTVFGSSKASGIGVSSLANPDLKWEKTSQVNAGLDIGLFNNRVNLEMDVYYKKTTDMLLSAPVPASSGFTSITKNVGSMSNKGFEFSINTVNITNENFSWETTFNISFNKNKVLALSEGPDILSSSNNIIRVGEPVGSFYGYKRLGTWGTDEAEEAAKYNLRPGDLKLWDRNNDGQINDMDRLIIGKGIPDGYGTFSNSFRYKNFDLVVDLQYMFGNDVLDISKHSAEDRTGIANSYKTVLNAWTPENQNTMIAQIRPTGAGYTTNIDSHFVEDGSFLRGKNLVLGYTFPAELTKKISIKYLRVYGSVQNFFLITKYNGYDPEVSDATQTFAQGITVFGYPKPRTFTIGLNVSF